MPQAIKQVLFPSSPLWMRAPCRDENNKLCSDFMMVIPSLNSSDCSFIEAKIQLLQQIIKQNQHSILYADINLKLKTIWISHRAILGVSRPIISSIIKAFPDAKIVGSGLPPEQKNITLKTPLLQKLKQKLFSLPKIKK